MDNPVRVLNLFTIMDRGGAESMVMNYYRNIDRSKIQFDFMVHRDEKGAFDEEILSSGGKIWHMPRVRPWTSSEYLKRARTFYLEHPEYKIVHSHMSELGYYNFIAAKEMEVPVRICHAHSSPHGIDIKSSVRWYYKKKMLPYITHMMTCGFEAGLWLYGRKNKEKLIQLNNAIDAEKFRFNPSVRDNVRRQMNIDNNQIVLGHVGRFDKAKNQEFIINVLSALYKIKENVVLLLIGNDNSETGELLHKIVDVTNYKENVRFLGIRSDVDALMQAMDVFVFPSIYEGLPVTLVEAQAAGLPCIVSDSIPSECKKTDLVRFLSLKESCDTWAESVLDVAQTQRKDTYEEIKRCGYDVKENARWLEDFYLNSLNTIERK